MLVFLNSGALWALGGLLLYGGIYLFRRRSKVKYVSSLMFFPNTSKINEGGHKLDKPKFPIILLIELLIALFFVLAAASPAIVSKDNKINIAVILDNSLSMRVKTGEDGKSAKERALKYLSDNVFSKPYYSVNLIKAGTTPELIGNNDMNVGEASAFIGEWNCDSIASDLSAAVAFAGEISSKDALKIVVTDTAIEKEKKDGNESSGNLLNLAFGVSAANLAITGANRYRSDEIDRCFFEFTNYSTEQQTLNAVIKNIDEKVIYENINVVLAAKETRRYILNVQELKADIVAEIKSDDFEEDNRVILKSVEKPKVKTYVEFDDKNLEKIMKYTVQVMDEAALLNDDLNVKGDPDLIISDKYNENFDGWQIVFHTEMLNPLAETMIAADMQHRLCEGIITIWATWVADKDFDMPGRLIMCSGNTKLVSVEEKDKKSVIWMNLDYKTSNIIFSVYWPMLFNNIFGDYQEKHFLDEQPQNIFKSESDFTELSTSVADINLNSIANKYLEHIGWWFLLAALALLGVHQYIINRWGNKIVY